MLRFLVSGITSRDGLPRCNSTASAAFPAALPPRGWYPGFSTVRAEGSAEGAPLLVLWLAGSIGTLCAQGGATPARVSSIRGRFGMPSNPTPGRLRANGFARGPGGVNATPVVVKEGRGGVSSSSVVQSTTPCCRVDDGSRAVLIFV